MNTMIADTNADPDLAFPPRRIFVTGASGTGTTTLGRALAIELGAIHCDIDDYQWIPTEPPFHQRRPPTQRLGLILDFLNQSEKWILSGHIEQWGDPLIPLFHRVVFLYLPTTLRIGRLLERERRRFGQEALRVGGRYHKRHTKFIDWTSHYDDGSRPGRSLPMHEAWLAQLPCPVVRIDGEHAVEDLVERVLYQPG